MNRCLCFFVLLNSIALLNVNACTNFKRESRTKLSNNGYTNLLISIDENVVENHLLIERIKESYTKASKFLYNATRSRFYFKEITILIPSTWSIKFYIDEFNENNDGKIGASTWEMYDRADICVEARDEATFDTPFTFNYNAECGSPADHSHFTPDYFLKRHEMHNLFGRYEHVLTHEWAHLRYGVFDEHPYKVDENNEEFYINSNGEIEATKCNTNLSGQLKNPYEPSSRCDSKQPSGLPANDCIFQDDLGNSGDNVTLPPGSASIMYRTHLDHLTEFCDSDPDKPETFHNRYAPTQQNKMCDGKSVWDVLRGHVDFKNYQSSILNIFRNEMTPQFKLVKKMPKRVVLLVDSALALKSAVTFFYIRSALRDYIRILLNDDDYVGIIHFDRNSKIVLPMTRVKDVNERKLIFDKVMPLKKNDDNANIWNALSLGLTLLKTTVENRSSHIKTGGNLVLITGANSDPKYPIRSQIYDQLDSNHVTIDAIRINDDYDEAVDYLARNTNGIYFHMDSDLPSNRVNSLDNALVLLSKRETNPLKQANILLDSRFTISESKFAGSFKVDRFVSDQLHSLISIKFVFRHVKNPLELTVFEPDNEGEHKSKYLTDCYDYYADDSFQLNDTQEIICKFVNPTAGLWNYEILNPNAGAIELSLRVVAAFHNADDPTTNFPFYYRSHAKKKKLNKNFIELKDRLDNVLQLEAKWSSNDVTYPKVQTIYAKLSKNFRPILNAQVKAIISRPSGDNITIRLYDDGLNSDRFKNDGIYSRNFINYNMDGIYSAQVIVETTAESYIHKRRVVGSPDIEHFPSIGVLSKIDESSFEPIDEMTRVIILESFRLTKYKEEDLIGPTKIRDLRITELNLENKTVTLNFTAPGNDGELGSAAYYDIKCMYDPEILVQYEDIEYSKEEIARVGKFQLMKDQPQHTLNEYLLPLELTEASFSNLEPNQGGFDEHFKFSLASFVQPTVSIRMRAIDRNGNAGAWSHIITIKVNNNTSQQLSPKIKHYYSHQELKASEESKHTLRKLITSKEKFYWKFSLSIIAIFVLIGIMQLCVTLVVIVLETRHRKSKNKYPADEYGPIRV